MKCALCSKEVHGNEPYAVRNRLLTMIEMSKAITERRRILELNGHKPTPQDARYAIAVAQRDLTRSETLRAVGEWLKGKIVAGRLPKGNGGAQRSPPGGWRPPVDDIRYDVEALLRGEMPE